MNMNMNIDKRFKNAAPGYEEFFYKMGPTIKLELKLKPKTMFKLNEHIGKLWHEMTLDKKQEYIRANSCVFYDYILCKQIPCFVVPGLIYNLNNNEKYCKVLFDYNNFTTGSFSVSAL